jgi:hypothetical protein
MFELIQFEIGMSTNRYFPAMGTAGFERLAVRGYKRVPAPPPRITAKIDFDIESFFYYEPAFLSFTVNLKTHLRPGFSSAYPT